MMFLNVFNVSSLALLHYSMCFRLRDFDSLEKGGIKEVYVFQLLWL